MENRKSPLSSKQRIWIQIQRAFSPVLLCGVVFSLTLSIAVYGLSSPHPSHSSESSMQKHYDSAQRFQSLEDLEEADFQYKLFLADALFDLAKNRAQAGEYAQSVPVFEEALQFSPDNAAFYLDFAEAALAAEDLPKAKQLAQEVLDLHTKDPEKDPLAQAHFILGKSFLGTNEVQKATEQFQAAVAIDPNFKYGYALAKIYLVLADKRDAAKIFKEMLTGFGDTAALHMQIGLAYGNADDLDEAIPEFKKTLAKNDKFPGAHYSLGACYLLKSGDAGIPEAAAEFHKEIALHPNDYLSYTQLGSIAEAQHQLPQAVQYLKRATKLNPNDPDTFLLLGRIYVQMNQPADAEAALRSAIAATTDISQNHYQIKGAHYQLGRLLIQDGNLAEGKKELQISHDLLLDNMHLDKANVTGERFVKPSFPQIAGASAVDASAVAALKTFENQIGPAIADSYNNLGVIAAIHKDYPSAAGYFQQASQWNPTMDGLDYNWGRAAYAAHLYVQAVVPLERYLQTHPEDIGARSTLGVSQYMSQDYAHALQTFRSIELHVEAVPALNFLYAESMVKTGDFTHGIERLKTMEQENPRDTSLRTALADAVRKNPRQ